MIRLRGPWEVEPPTAAADAIPPESRGVIRFNRRFGSPTGLQPNDEVDLVFEGISSTALVWLNDALLGELAPPEPARFGILPQLKARNVLLVEVRSPEAIDSKRVPEFADFVREVRLEILAR